MWKQLWFFHKKIIQVKLELSNFSVPLVHIFLVGLELFLQRDGEHVQQWKNAPDLDLGQKGAQDFTLFSGLWMTVSKISNLIFSVYEGNFETQECW